MPQTSHWNRLKQFVRKNDSMIPADHKRVWFEKMARWASDYVIWVHLGDSGSGSDHFNPFESIWLDLLSICQCQNWPLCDVMCAVSRFTSDYIIYFFCSCRSNKAPEEIKESLSQQMDSYNLLTLLLLATVIPTATGICDEMRWDEDGWPLSRTRFAYLASWACKSL